jgi:hypothetical protein
LLVELAELEQLVAEALEDAAVTEVIRPAAVVPEASARAITRQLAALDVRAGGIWYPTPTLWQRYDRPWLVADNPGESQLVGTMQVAYGVPTRYEITVFRATITRAGSAVGWTVTALCDEALGYGGLDLATCPRADLRPPPPVFRLQ